MSEPKRDKISIRVDGDTAGPVVAGRHNTVTTQTNTARDHGTIHATQHGDQHIGNNRLVTDDREPPIRPGQPGVDSAEERQLLLGWLAFHRGALAANCHGLTGTQLVTRSVPPSRLSLLGLVRHLTEMERVYLTLPLRGMAIELLYCTDDDEDGDFESVRANAADADIARWRVECALSDRLLSDVDLDDTPPVGSGTVRWRVQKLLLEYSRHNGHADLLRETLDGATGE